MCLHHLRGVHPVHVIGTENHDVLGLLVGDQIHRLEYGVGAAGVPARPEPLLRRHRRDVLAMKARTPPGLRDVPVEGVRLVLRQYANPFVAGVYQIRQHKVDEAIGTAERHRRFGTVHRQWVQALALAAGEDDTEHVRL